MRDKHLVQLNALTHAQWLALAAIESQCHAAPWSLAALQSCTAAQYAAHALCDANGAVLGYSIFLQNVDDWELLNLTVAPAWQGTGLGHLLMQQGIAAARAAGTQSLFLEVRPSNVAALALYASHGFKTVGSRKSYYRTANPLVQEDATIMRLEFV